jgi:phytoene synthase
MYAVYAFCRVVDDIADGDKAPAEKRAGLAAWREEVGRLYDGNPKHPVSRALAAPVAEYSLAAQDFIAVIEGMEMDATERMVAPSMGELELYCQRVAGAVGLLSVRIFGLNGEEGQRLARSLGQALQLTNLLRDLAEDADAGRLYLPRELLEAHGIEDRTPKGVLAHPALGLVCDDLAEVAEGCFAEARDALAACHRGNSRPARVMMSVYHALLGRLRARGFQRLDEPVRMGTVEKFWIALREGLF